MKFFAALTSVAANKKSSSSEEDHSLFPIFRRKAQQFICRNTIQFTQCRKMTERQLIGTPFISGIHGLGCSKIFRNIFLCHIMVFP